MKIPLSKPYVPKNILASLEKVIRSGILHGNAGSCVRVEELMEERFGFKHVLLTTSGTHSLELSMMLLDAHEGDEVILPSFTFVSTANAVLRAGLTPVFADIDDKTLNISPGDVARLITPRTRAIVPVHYAGVACEMDLLLKLANEGGLMVIEDAAHAIGSTYKGQFLGGVGQMGCFSFHGTKNITCGEGGAFVTNDDSLASRAEIIREKGTNRAQFMKGIVDKYTWVDIGSSYVLSEILAAFLEAELNEFDFIQERRKSIYDFYIDHLRPLEKEGLLQLPVIPSYAESNYHLFHIILPSEEIRNKLMAYLRNAGIDTAFHYVPLHTSPFGSRFARGELPVTDRIASCLLRLPLYPELESSKLAYIIENVRGFFGGLI